ncbi:uncharacterized protein BO80DRAFT_440708 [Aspergillus ibericus CBS 121593]|uniref:MFS general substrate transporter n=1 Tax=Aspergillus ibericus CBS 121593 TaxID=1448316 RepID=A0A395HEU3_9EURO|nr:hypothetical protein BO80DRAFT_440708 [Aspergillus ibericus CBS 121593]RAL05973.1 hypothetical protein BO80DRAFT_440708 [Aspergillus ibericus CBS 121593]
MDDVALDNRSPNALESNHTLAGEIGREQEPSTTQRKKPPSFYLSMLMLSLITIIVSWDATALSVALATITSPLQGTTFQSFWASIAFTLGVAVTQPIYASVSDVLGRKLPLYVAMEGVAWTCSRRSFSPISPPLDAAKSILPFCLLLVALSIITSVVIDWTRRYRLAFWLGWILTTVFLGLLYRVGRDTSRAELTTFQVFLGSGIGIILTAGTVAMLASVTRVDDAGLAVGLLLVFRILGSLLGLAIASTVFSSIFQKSIAAIGTLPGSLSILKDSSRAVDFIPELRTLDLSNDVMDRVIDAYQKTFQAIWLVLACIAALASLISFLIRHLTLEKEEVGRQGFQSSS